MIKAVLACALLLASQIQEKKILFVGDSMTAFPGGWHDQFAKRLGKQYVNSSVPGKRTDWMKYTLIETLKSDREFSTCFIYGGINDAFAQVKAERVLFNMQEMVDTCNKLGIEPVVIVGYDPSKVMVESTTKKKEEDIRIKRYIQIQDLLIRELKNCKIIPMAENVMRSDSNDGVHFTKSGHSKFSDWVYENYVK